MIVFKEIGLLDFEAIKKTLVWKLIEANPTEMGAGGQLQTRVPAARAVPVHGGRLVGPAGQHQRRPRTLRLQRS